MPDSNRRRQRDYAAEYRARKARAQQRLDAERSRRRERLEILGRAKHTTYVPPAHRLYYQTPGQQRYWEQTYPARVKAMSPAARRNLARTRGIDLVFPGWDDDENFPEAISDAIAEYYLLGFMSRSRAFPAQDARQQAIDLYATFAGAGNVKPNWRAFREAYSRTFNR